jgi:hypothetical protein
MKCLLFDKATANVKLYYKLIVASRIPLLIGDHLNAIDSFLKPHTMNNLLKQKKYRGKTNCLRRFPE